jgi:hypothetical protein
MTVPMTNKRFPKHGPANVQEADVATWEADGWVKVPAKKTTKTKGEK